MKLFKCKYFNYIFLFIFILGSQIKSQPCIDTLNPISEGYGSDNTCDLLIDSISGKIFLYDDFYVIKPANKTNTLPLIFFLPGMGKANTMYKTYEHLVRHIASKGYCVILITYKIMSFPYQGLTYNRILNTINASFRYCSNNVDSTKIGFIGHSFGAGAIPFIAHKVITENKWGNKAAFMYIMAPHYFFEISQSQLTTFPCHVKLIVEVFDNDDTNDHRIAKDLFININIPKSEKDFIIIRSDTLKYDTCKLIADHSLPTTSNLGKRVLNLLDYYGVFRYIDALADYCFNANLSAKEIALGNGNKKQKFMGTWKNGQPIKQAIISDSCPLIRPTTFYFFNWNHPWNPRKKDCQLFMPDSADIR